MYLIGGMIKYNKYIFWEVPYYTGGEIITLNEDQCIHHVSELSDMKTYWNYTSWYEKEDSEESIIVKDRINKLVNDFGKELPGLARASNSIAMPVFMQILNTKPDYVNFS